MNLFELSLGYWVTIIFIVYTLSLFADYNKSRRINNKQVAILLALVSGAVLIIFAGVRRDVGDTPVYISFFKRHTDSLSETWKNMDIFNEGGFELLQTFIKKFVTSDPYCYIFLMSLIPLGLVLCIFYKYGRSFSLCILLFILSGNYVTSMNGIRQFFVASILFFCFKWIYEKRYFKYVLLVLLLSTIHKSAILFIAFAFVLNLPAWKKGSKGIMMGGILIYLLYPISSQWFNLLLSNTGYANYGEGIVSGGPGGANIIRALVYLVPVGMGYMMRETLKVNEKYYNIMVNGAILNFIFMLLATASSWIFARYCIYFNLYSIMLLVWSIHYMKKSKRDYYLVCVLCYSIFFIYEMKSYLI